MENERLNAIIQKREELLGVRPAFEKPYPEIADILADSLLSRLPDYLHKERENLGEKKKKVETDYDKRKWARDVVETEVLELLVEEADILNETENDDYFIAVHDMLVAAADIMGHYEDAEDALEGIFTGPLELSKIDEDDTHEVFLSFAAMAKAGATLLQADPTGLKFVNEAVSFICGEENELADEDFGHEYIDEFVIRGAILTAEAYTIAHTFISNEE